METINITIAYAKAHSYYLQSYQVSPDSTVEDAIKQSSLLNKFPEIELNNTKVGIFGKNVTLNQSLKNGDRIEIYRPLVADPKEIRRQRALNQKTQNSSSVSIQSDHI